MLDLIKPDDNISSELILSEENTRENIKQQCLLVLDDSFVPLLVVASFSSHDYR